MKKSFYYILAIIALLVYKLLPFIIVVAIIGLIIVKFEQDNKKISDNISGNISTKNIHDINYTKDYLDISKRQGEKLQAVVNELDKLDISEKNKVIHGIRSLQMEYWHKRKNIYISNLYDYILKFANIRLGDIKYDSSKKEYEMILQIVQMLNEESSIENVVGFVSLRNENTTTDNDNVTDDNTQKQLEKIPNKCYGVGEYIKTCTAEFENHEQKTYLNISVQNMFSNNVQPTIENNLKNSKKDRFEISEQQLEKIKEITKIYKDSKCIEIHKIIIRLLSFCSEYYSRNNKMVLYDYIIKAAYQRIKTAKRDYIKKECESVLQIVHSLKNGVEIENIFCDNCDENGTIISKETAMTKNDNVTDKNTQKQLEFIPDNYCDVDKKLKTCDAEYKKQEESNYANFSVSSQIMSGLSDNVIFQKNLKANSIEIIVKHDVPSNDVRISIDDNKQFEFPDKNVAEDNVTENQKQKNNNNVYSAKIEKVPYWKHVYVYSVSELQNANSLQKRFYYYFKEQFFKDFYLDIGDNSNYAFVLMFDLADEYKTHMDYDLLKHQLYTLAEHYPIVAKYINDALDKVVIAVNIQEVEKLLQHYDKSHEKLYNWVTPNESVEVQGIKLTRGNFYIGKCSILAKSNYDPAINQELQASDIDTCKNIFCSYKDMSPAFRYEYLMWLSGEKEPFEVSLEVILFYLYGCEIRMFIDPQTKDIEREIILVDIIHLYNALITKLFKDNKKVLKYFNEFVGCAIIKYFYTRLNEFNVKNILKQSEIYQYYSISQKVAGRKSLSSEDAFNIAYEIYDIEQLIPSTYMSVARDYFIDKYNDLYNKYNINFEIKNREKVILYDYGYFYVDSRKIDLYYQIDSFYSDSWMFSVGDIRTIHYVIFDSYCNIKSEFENYLCKVDDSGGKETINAILSLPDKININEIPKIKELIDIFDNETKSNTYIIKPIEWFLSLLEYECQDMKNIPALYVYQITKGLRRMGYDIVPNYEIDNKRVAFKDIIVLYKNEKNDPVIRTKKYETAELFAKLASYVVYKDHISSDVFAFVEQQLQLFDDSVGNQLHLSAYFRWCVLSKRQQLSKQIQNNVKMLTNELRVSMGNSLVRLVCINGDIRPKHIENLKKVLKLLGMETDNINSQIIQILPDSDGFAVIEKKSDATDFTITAKPQLAQQSKTSKVVMDSEKLRMIENQTKEAQELLSNIFAEDDAAMSDNTISGNTSDEWMEILRLLLTKNIWACKEIENECKERGLMLGAVLEQINDYSYKIVDDTVLELDGDYLYVTLDYKKQLI